MKHPSGVRARRKPDVIPFGALDCNREACERVHERSLAVEPEWRNARGQVNAYSPIQWASAASWSSLPQRVILRGEPEMRRAKRGIAALVVGATVSGAVLVPTSAAFANKTKTCSAETSQTPAGGSGGNGNGNNNQWQTTTIQTQTSACNSNSVRGRPSENPVECHTPRPAVVPPECRYSF